MAPKRTPKTSRKKKNASLPSGSTAQAIMHAAKRLFAEKGFAGVSIREITHSAKVNVSLINYHFKNKEGLYRACIETFGKRVLASAGQLIVESKSQEEFELRLQLFSEAILESFIQEPHLTLMVHREAEMQSNLTEDIFKATFFKLFEKLRDLFISGQEKGYVSKEVDVGVAPLLLVGMVIHLTRVEKSHKKFFGRSLFDETFRKLALEQIRRVFCHGVCT